MDLYLLAELKTIALKITTVDMLKPPPDSTPPPILIDAGVAVYVIQLYICVSVVLI